MSANSDLQADVRAASHECLLWMQTLKMSLETVALRAGDRDAQIDIGALGKLVVSADKAMNDLDGLIEKLLAGDIEDETQHLLFEGLSKYASPSFWWKRSGKPSQAEADKGEFARSILEKISTDQGEGEGSDD